MWLSLTILKCGSCIAQTCWAYLFGCCWDGNDSHIGEAIIAILIFVFIFFIKLFIFPAFFSSFRCSLYFFSNAASQGKLTLLLLEHVFESLTSKSPWYLCLHESNLCFRNFASSFFKTSKIRQRNGLLLFEPLYFSIYIYMCVCMGIRSYFNEENQCDHVWWIDELLNFYFDDSTSRGTLSKKKLHCQMNYSKK